MHPPYNLVLAPSDPYRFLYMVNHFAGKKIQLLKINCPSFFAIRNEDFYENIIMKLLLKKRQVFEQNGAYMTTDRCILDQSNNAYRQYNRSVCMFKITVR